MERGQDDLYVFRKKLPKLCGRGQGRPGGRNTEKERGLVLTLIPLFANMGENTQS